MTDLVIIALIGFSLIITALSSNNRRKREKTRGYIRFLSIGAFIITFLLPESISLIGYLLSFGFIGLSIILNSLEIDHRNYKKGGRND